MISLAQLSSDIVSVISALAPSFGESFGVWCEQSTREERDGMGWWGREREAEVGARFRLYVHNFVACDLGGKVKVNHGICRVQGFKQVFAFFFCLTRVARERKYT